MPETASPLEIAWSIVSAFGLLTMARVLARRIAREARRRGNGGAKIASRYSIAKAGIGFAIQLIGCSIGLLAALTPEPIRPQVTVFQAVATLGVMAINILTVAWSIAEERKDRALERYYRDMERRLAHLEVVGVMGDGSRHEGDEGSE